MALSRRIAPKVRVDVMRLLLDRGYGKPPTEVNISSGSAVDLTDVDLSKLTDAQLEELYELSARTAAILEEVKGEAVH